MPKNLLRTLETLAGGSQVLHRGQALASVLYTLTVRQEWLGDGAEGWPGPKFIDGRLWIIAGERNLPTGTELSLPLPDGREAICVVRQGDPLRATCTVHVPALRSRPLGNA